jgi:hypothetical protein
MARVLLVTHGTAGDVLPFVRIGAAVRALGHEARLIGPAPYAAAAARAGLDFAAPDTEAGYRAAQRRTPDLLAARRPADLRDYYEREGLFDQLRREAERLASWHEPGRTVLVGRHTSALSALVAAELLGAPVAWVAVAPIQLMVAPVAAAHVRHGLAEGIGAVRSALGLPPVADWPAWLRSARATLGLWPAWFDTAGPPAPPGTTLTGFVSGDAGGAAFSGDAGDDSAGGGRDDRAGGRAVLGTGGAGGTGGGWDDGASIGSHWTRSPRSATRRSWSPRSASCSRTACPPASPGARACRFRPCCPTPPPCCTTAASAPPCARCAAARRR